MKQPYTPSDQPFQSTAKRPASPVESAPKTSKRTKVEQRSLPSGKGPNFTPAPHLARQVSSTLVVLDEHAERIPLPMVIIMPDKRSMRVSMSVDRVGAEEDFRQKQIKRWKLVDFADNMNSSYAIMVRVDPNGRANNHQSVLNGSIATR